MDSYRLPLSQEELFRALYCGHGRAVQHLRAYPDAGLEQEFLDAFLFDYRHDLQLEDGRAPWLCNMLGFVRNPERYRRAVCSVLRKLDSPESWHADQLCELAREFAARGHAPARTALEKAFERIGVGGQELIELDGVAALPRVYAMWGRFDWWSRAVMDGAAKIVGREAAMATLEAEAERSETAAELLREIRAQEKLLQARSTPLTLAEILVDIEGGKESRCVSFGKWASDHDREKIYQRLLREDRPEQIGCLLRVFHNHRTPELHERLFDLAASPDERIRWNARRALGQWQDERVQAFARKLLDARPKGEMKASVLELFVRNFEPQDAARIEARLGRVPDDEHAEYSIAAGLIEIAEANETPLLAGCLLWAYEHSPAACIRSWAVRELMRRGALPEFVRQECLDDSYAGTRALVGEGGDSHT